MPFSQAITFDRVINAFIGLGLGSFFPEKKKMLFNGIFLQSYQRWQINALVGQNNKCQCHL
jgi:hypothetical protein